LTPLSRGIFDVIIKKNIKNKIVFGNDVIKSKIAFGNGVI